MSIISILLLAGYLTGIVKFITLYEDVETDEGKFYLYWFRFGYIMATIFWPITVSVTLLVTFINVISKKE
ncbi:MAG: hypothetical protein RBT15_04640 [Gudongella sp.]|jgi:hypothetical protein|nr:hypothetical protein [Gudongella sp.]